MNQQHAQAYMLRKWLLIFICIDAVGIIFGAIFGWLVAGNSPTGTRWAAAFAGALVAFLVTSISLHIIRGIKLIKSPTTVTRNMDWRERSGRINERTLRNFIWLREHAWIFALAYSVPVTGLYTLVDHSFYWLFSFPFNFFLIFFVVRLIAWFGIKTNISANHDKDFD